MKRKRPLPIDPRKIREFERQNAHWTEEEKADLVLLWSELTNPQLEARFSRSIDSIKAKALRLGLACIPRGMEPVRTAAERLGFHRRSFAKILAWANTKTTPSRGSKKGRSTEHRLVSSDAAEKAVLKWLSTATPTDWARERGFPVNQVFVLIKYAKEQGLWSNPRAKFGRTYRVTKSEFDELMESWENRSTRPDSRPK